MIMNENIKINAKLRLLVITGAIIATGAYIVHFLGNGLDVVYGNLWLVIGVIVPILVAAILVASLYTSGLMRKG